LKGRREFLGQRDLKTIDTTYDLGEMYLQLGRYEKAEPLLLQAHELSAEILGDQHLDTRQRLESLFRLYETSGRPAEADRWRSKLPATAPATQSSSQPAS
jgi:hypothetical protein